MKTLLALFLVGWSAGTALAASTNDWLSFDAGGNTSTSALYSASYTLGQADAGKSASTNYAIIGGFWAVASFTAAPNPPELWIARAGPNVQLWWPTDSAGFFLQMNPSVVQPAGWATVDATATTNGAIKSVLLTPAPSPSFFRLKKD